MNYLLDTHVVLWWLSDPKKIAKKAKQIIQDREQAIFISSVSFWEMAVKSSLGRLNIPRNMLNILLNDGFQTLPLEPEAALSIIDLPDFHKDPFDRMLVSQAKYHDMVFITRDKHIKKYPLVTVNG